MRCFNILFLLLWLIVIGCGENLNEPKTIIGTQENVTSLLGNELEIIKQAPKNSNNQLAFDLYKALSSTDNITYSPFSISLALAMAYAGAKGDTETAMKNVLHFGDNTINFHKSYGQFANLLSSKDRSKDEAILKISNHQWLQKNYNILQSYKDILANSYIAQPTYLDFLNEPTLATKTINDKVSEETNKEIPKLLKKDLENNTRLVLTNAIFFNAKWQNIFPEGSTSNDNFATKTGPITVQYMKQTNQYNYSEDNDKQVLLMPYKDQDFATLFILPKAEKLSSLEQQLTATNFASMIDSLKPANVEVWLPKFSQRTAPNMKEVLTDLGLGIIFDPGKADLSGINGSPGLFVGDVVHEAVVKMYEAGTTAAAATAVIISEKSAISEPKEVVFHATRPFLFFIIHKPSSTILFMGRVDTPTSSEK